MTLVQSGPTLHRLAADPVISSSTVLRKITGTAPSRAFRPPASALISAIAFGLFLSLPLAAAPLRCPPMLPSAHPGFDQVGPAPAWHWQLMQLRLFEQTPNDAAKTAPTERHPDQSVGHINDYTLNWRFSGNEDLLMTCIYNGSATYYIAHLQPKPKTCTMRNDNGLSQAWCE